MKNRAVIYLRVSKGERHTENQRPDVDRVISTRGLELIAEYEEKESAAKTRPVFDRMMREAHRRSGRATPRGPLPRRRTEL